MTVGQFRPQLACYILGNDNVAGITTFLINAEAIMDMNLTLPKLCKNCNIVFEKAGPRPR